MNIPTPEQLERNGVFMEEYVLGTMLVEVYLYKGKQYKIFNVLFGNRTVEVMG